MGIIIFLSLAIDLSLGQYYSLCLGLSLFPKIWDLGMHQVYIVQQSYCSTSTLHVLFLSVPIISSFFKIKLLDVPGASSSITPCWIRWDKQILGSKSGSVGGSRSNTMHTKETGKTCQRVELILQHSKISIHNNYMNWIINKINKLRKNPKQPCP